MVEEREEEKWLKECLKVFPELGKDIKIKCFYKKTPRKCLGRVMGRVDTKKDIDVESLLFEGKVKKKIVRKKPGRYEIEINKNLKRIKRKAIRKQVVQYVIVHELLHIANEDILVLSKDYSRRKKKKIHVKDFKKEFFRRYNELRKLNNLPQISKQEDLNLAINKILEKYKVMEEK
ncbi:MAG: hypothetical protein QW762_04375 [Candidatus Thermoplasmatota archaeon]